MWPAGVLRHEASAKVAPVIDLRLALEADAGHWTSIDAPVVLSSSLAPGQSFGWKKLDVTGQDAFLGVLNLSAILFVQRDKGIRWQTLAGPEVTQETVQKFFALDDGLGETAERLRIAWAERCPRLAQVAQSLPGLCVLQQDMVETIFGFICSQNNNVSRICLLMDRLRAKFGQVLCSIAAGIDAQADGDLAVLREFNNHRKLYAFPRIEQLASASESSLKSLGLGYRAAYVRAAAKTLLQKDGKSLKWLEDCRHHSPDLKTMDPLQAEEPEALRLQRLEIRKELCRLPGVGPKVADCIALFALKQHGAVPVDARKLCDLISWVKALEILELVKRQGEYQECFTNLPLKSGPEQRSECPATVAPRQCITAASHKRAPGEGPQDVHVWRIVTRDYDPALREAKSLNPAVYERVGDAFRRRFGAVFAGWAHSLLFGAEFGALRAKLPAKVLEEMDHYRDEEKLAKTRKKILSDQVCGGRPTMQANEGPVRLQEAKRSSEGLLLVLTQASHPLANDFDLEGTPAAVEELTAVYSQPEHGGGRAERVQGRIENREKCSSALGELEPEIRKGVWLLRYLPGEDMLAAEGRRHSRPPGRKAQERARHEEFHRVASF
eukprot:s336_g13.t2